MDIIIFLKINVNNKIDENLFNYFTCEEIICLNNIKNEVRKKQFLISKLIVKYFGNIFLSLKSEIPSIITSENGKPYFKDYPNLHFNIAHSKDVIVVSFSLSKVGIDIEQIKEQKFLVAKKLFSNQENQYILANTIEMKRRFLEIWTKKEAYIKCYGKKISCIKYINIFDVNIQKNMQTFEKDGYLFSVYTDRAYIKFEIIIMEENDLMKILKKSSTPV